MRGDSRHHHEEHVVVVGGESPSGGGDPKGVRLTLEALRPRAHRVPLQRVEHFLNPRALRPALADAVHQVLPHGHGCLPGGGDTQHARGGGSGARSAPHRAPGGGGEGWGWAGRLVWVASDGFKTLLGAPRVSSPL